MITSYATLKEAVANEFVTTEIVGHLETAIQLVEANINRNVRVRRMIARDTASIDSRYTSFPSDFLSVAGLQINTNPVKKLEFITIEQMDDLKPDYRSSGVPHWFTIVGLEIEVLPIPDSAYEAELTYYEKIPALSDANTSNWLLASYPDVYFYGALSNCAGYIRDRYDRPDKRGATWKELFEAAKEELLFEDQKNRFSQGRLAMRTRRAYS